MAAALALPLGACATGTADRTAAAPSAQPTTAPATAPAAPVPPAVPFDQAVANAANTLLANAKLPEGGGAGRYPVVIDPLIDGVTGAQSNATQSIQARIADLVRERYPQYEIQPFSARTVNQAPLVLVGTFTPVNAENKTAGDREAYRICLVLADLKSGRTVGKGTARALMDGVDATPTRYFQESPAWSADRHTDGYISTCQGTKVGDPINPAYLDGILTASMIAEAIDAYDAGRYQDALDLYGSALQAPAGQQLRTYNGIYLSSWRLGQRDRAVNAFGDLVDYGLKSNKLGVKFLFKPGTTAFWADPELTEQYGFWLQQIAQKAVQNNACLEVAGHTSRSGPPALNERLSLLRAEYVKSRLESEAPPLAKRTIASGVGARENLIGTGQDGAADALDRRVEFKVVPAC